ncbi:MAG: ATP-binding protein [Chloroflexota bacterium]
MDDRLVASDYLTAVLEARRQARRLALFAGVLADDIGRGFTQLLDQLAEARESGRLDVDDLALTYGRLFVLLASEAELYPEPLVGDAWQNHLLDRLLIDENPYSRKAQVAGDDGVGEALTEMAGAELRVLQSVFGLTSRRVCDAVGDLLKAMDGKYAADWLVSWDRLQPMLDGIGARTGEELRLKRSLATAADWAPLIAVLGGHYATRGTGVLSRYRAFRWVQREGKGQLEGIAVPDSIRLSDLMEYDHERNLLLRNTEQFLAGFQANNVLLYGDRGTGKSSTVKALLNEYGDKGLRLIEVPRHLLGDYAQIVATVRARPEKFVLFVDDLSFDEHETGYKGLKAILEGSLEAKPRNLILYATSNRRHLVQEHFSDRTGAANGDEIHVQDTAQEKLSLSDRFGITLTFLAPDQDRFLRIVAGLVAQRGLPIGADDLRARALAWASRHNGRSGRTARQFVDYLTGELLMMGNG